MSPLENQLLPTISILGVGSMGGAILKGLTKSRETNFGAIRVTTASERSVEELRELPGVSGLSLEQDKNANVKSVAGAGVVILGVKPWMIADLLSEIRDHLEPGALVISIAAGITIDSMQAALPENLTVMRAMPNTPAIVRLGLTGLTAGAKTPPEAFDLARRVFNSVGEVIVVDSEEKLDALSAISGSGPAYVYLFIEKLATAAEELGFSEAEAKILAEGTFIGATALLRDQGADPAELRRNVTSPGGTTEQAIASFEAAGLGQIFSEALKAAITRAEEIARS